MGSIDYEYTTVDVDLLVHPKAIAAGVEAMGLWLWAMAWSHKTGANGKIPRAVVVLAWGATKPVIDKLTKRLVSSGLWVATDEGWEIWNYGKKNAEEKARRRQQGRERMARFRDRSRAPKSDAGSDALSDASPNGSVRCLDGAPAPVSDLDLRSGSPESFAVPTAESAGARYQAAYAAGISRGKCSPWVWPGSKYAEWDLGKIISGHAKDPNGKGYRGEQLLRFIEATAAEFASDVIERKKAQYYFAFEPRGCLKWLNEAEMAEEARRVG
jgi:hypothetical protein